MGSILDKASMVLALPFIAVLYVLCALCWIYWLSFRKDWADFPFPI